MSTDQKQQCACLHQGFDRQETMLLSGVTSSRLAYLDLQKVIVPQKLGHTKKPHILYSWEQVLQVKVLTHFKQKLSLVQIKKIVRFFNDIGIIENWGDRHLAVAGDEIYPIAPDWSDMPGVMLAAASAHGGGAFCVAVLPNMDKIIADVWRVAIESDAIDTDSFVERAKADPPLLLNC